PVCPHVFTKFPSFVNFAIRLFVPKPSATYTLPARSQVTSDGRLKLSPLIPAPAPRPPPRPPPPPPPAPPRPASDGDAAAGGRPPLAGTPAPGRTGMFSGLRPSTNWYRPSASNLTT